MFVKETIYRNNRLEGIRISLVLEKFTHEAPQP